MAVTDKINLEGDTISTQIFDSNLVNKDDGSIITDDGTDSTSGKKYYPKNIVITTESIIGKERVIKTIVKSDSTPIDLQLTRLYLNSGKEIDTVASWT